jgi:hypothetical protein
MVEAAKQRRQEQFAAQQVANFSASIAVMCTYTYIAVRRLSVCHSVDIHMPMADK